MPLFGQLDHTTVLPAAPTIASLTPDTWNLPGAETLQVSYEVDEAPALAVTLSPLHPSIPPYATFTVCRFPDSPVGPFNLAMIRLIVRAGIRPRGLLVRAFSNSEPAAAALRAQWGYRIELADVGYSRRHDQVRGTVSIDEVPALDISLVDPQPVAGQDIELFDNLHLVNTGPDLVDEYGPALIVQVDPTYEYHRAERGRPDLALFDSARLGAEGIDPVYAVVAVGCVADMALAAPRFVMDPAQPAVQGTRRLQPSPT